MYSVSVLVSQKEQKNVITLISDASKHEGRGWVGQCVISLINDDLQYPPQRIDVSIKISNLKWDSVKMVVYSELLALWRKLAHTVVNFLFCKPTAHIYQLSHLSSGWKTNSNVRNGASVTITPL